MKSPSFIYHSPRRLSANSQDLMPARYGKLVQAFSMAAFTLAFAGWLNETWLFLFDNPIWLNRYTEYAIILGFGIWRIIAEKNSYTRRRLIILVFSVTAFWWLVPWLFPFNEPYMGYLWGQPVFPSIHVAGTITFFIILGAVFLFGRRVVCGFNCPCVGIRETVGFAFRNKTLRSGLSWSLRHSKWFFFTYYAGVMVVTQFPPNTWTVSFVSGFYLIVALTYFGSFYLAPVFGNRFYCRYLCPYGATFGLLNHAGFYGIDMDKNKCIDCQRCEQVCDMGIPVWRQGKASGRVTALEDCMGCARCIVSCPTDALEIRDVRNYFNKNLVQNASRLLRRSIAEVTARKETEHRSPTKRLADWSETRIKPDFSTIQAQARRCLDCGSPGCISACPLGNRIPEWLEHVASGNMQRAAEIAHATSSMPEICGTLCPQHRLCEGSCTKAKESGGAVTIGAIERYLSDAALDNGWKVKTPVRNSRRIAVIGAGPAGLACADELSKAGCDVTVYDKEKQIGGLLLTGVPPFKMDKSFLLRRREILEKQGVIFKTETEVDELMMGRLVESCDAVFLGLGAQTPRNLNIPGLNLKGVMEALSYLSGVNSMARNHRARSKDKHLPLKGKRVIVVGGGDSAVDCARSSLREGVREVSIVYRRDEKAMRASPKEIKEALEEGVLFKFNHIPVAVKGSLKVRSVIFKNDSGVEKSYPCDRVIIAAGQILSPPTWLNKFDIETDKEGLIVINENGRTSSSKIYAGGDNTNGPDLVVTAVASGRRAAKGILKSFGLYERIKKEIGINHIYEKRSKSSAAVMNSAGVLEFNSKL